MFRATVTGSARGAGLLGLLIAVAAPTAHAQQTVDEDFELEEENEAQDVADTTAAESGGDVNLLDDETVAAERLGDEQALVEEQVGVEQRRSGIDPGEDKGHNYFFLGAFYRHTFQPEWMLNWFFDKSHGTDNGGGGLELTWRRDSFSVVASVWYQLARTEGAYQQSGDTLSEIEWIESDMSVLFASATFLWATDFNDVFALEYGFGVGLGATFGSLRRTEAYPANFVGPDGSPLTPQPLPRDPYLPCAGNDDPIGGEWCDGIEDDDPRFSREEKRWSQGGNIPNIWPWLSLPHLALRIKPIKQLVFRIEGGFSTAGPFVGAGAAVGF